ncbi:MAG: ribulose-phosphate 3-epimerase [Parcubacteria group bacterium Gr01-1014_24]|nr:MAG: ribulose-phosphate 3-epimerase [Parcubacteria group bacterium Gr01-1014_24]
MASITPAILERDFNEIKNKLTFLRGRAKTVHIDIQDGIFTEKSTWPFASGGFNDMSFLKIMNEEEGMPFWQEFDFELDLMVTDAVENFDLYVRLGPKRIIFHLGAQKNIEEFEHFLEGLDIYVRDNVEIGVAFEPSDDLGLVSRLSHKVDFLHCMGSDKIGFQGEAFSEKALENIKFLKKDLPGVVISVDIGVNLENAPMILHVGADRLTVGSSLWRSPDPIGTLEAFQNLV